MIGDALTAASLRRFMATALSVIGAVTPATTLANVVGKDALFSSLCIEDQSTGFNWKAGAWVGPIHFKPEKYLVEKLDPTGKYCAAIISGGLNYIGDKNGFTTGCYSIRDFGTPRGDYDGIACDESWSVKEGVLTLTLVSCTGFQTLIFAADGNFHLARINANLTETPRDDYKDSLVVSVGKCSVIKS